MPLEVRQLARPKRLLQQIKASPLRDLANTLTSWLGVTISMWRLQKANNITEGFDKMMEMLSRRAYGFRYFENYRLRVLTHCGWAGRAGHNAGKNHENMKCRENAQAQSQTRFNGHLQTKLEDRAKRLSWPQFAFSQAQHFDGLALYDIPAPVSSIELLADLGIA